MQPQFRRGERVRVTGAFDAPLEGALGRVDDLIRVDIGNGAVAYDVTVLLEEPVDVWGDRNPASTLQNIRALTKDFIPSESNDDEADD